jgi:acyl carrier protein phosphodiesterase
VPHLGLTAAAPHTWQTNASPPAHVDVFWNHAYSASHNLGSTRPDFAYRQCLTRCRHGTRHTGRPAPSSLQRYKSEVTRTPFFFTRTLS